MLEEFRNSKEECRSFLSTESLPDVEQVDDFGEEDTTFPRADGSLVEHSSFLNNGLSRRMQARKSVNRQERDLNGTCRGSRWGKAATHGLVLEE